MNRLIISAIGVILTFIWIVYTAPPNQNIPVKVENSPVKKIIKSGSTSVNRIRQPVIRLIQPYNFRSVNFPANSCFNRQYI